MTTWFTADLHFGHRNIIDYCDRPFADVDAMNRALIGNWNETVAENDTIWVVGNHDRCWHGHGKRAEGWTERYLDAGFDEVIQDSARIKIGDRTVVACHFPYRGDSHDHDRFVDHRPIDKGAWLIHGHVHERWAQQGRMINVGVDATGFRPVSESAIAEIIGSGPQRRSASTESS